MTNHPETDHPKYAARLEIDYPEKWDKLTVFFRIIWFIPIGIIVSLISENGGIAIATALLIIFRRRYPRWWFDFLRELTRFEYRAYAYLLLLTEQYPSTVEEQAVHLEIDYPNVTSDLNRWMPLVNWLLAIPHYIILAVLWIAALFVTVYAWFVILWTGEYPRNLFDFVVGVARWSLRVDAYVRLLVTDRYPPFSLK
jgi:hypothetical protein